MTTSTRFQKNIFDLLTPEQQAGFRLHSLEVYNWGTFHQQVWNIDPIGNNTLLTGDIGSGKSTLVDAITTLLVPHHRITYNKAAGAEAKERTLYSYIRGEFKNTKDDLTQTAKAVALRDDNSYSVLLGFFYNEGFKQSITIAQVFWLKDNNRNPERLFIVATERLNIAEHFANFGSNISKLRDRLKSQVNVVLLDTFKEYSTAFRRHFGIHNEQALELFYQTVSMKSVGNLTDFVRNHMLEKTDVSYRIKELCNTFDNLNSAHEAVLKARLQIECLRPLMKNADDYEQSNDILTGFRICRDAIPAYFAQREVILLQEKIADLQRSIKFHKSNLQKLINDCANLRSKETSLITSIADNGGRRLQAIIQEIQRLECERDIKHKQSTIYQDLSSKLNLQTVANELEFGNQQQQIQQLVLDIEVKRDALQQQQTNLSIDKRDFQLQYQQTETEIKSLQMRKSNIPSSILSIRDDMIKTLNLDEHELPFIGEILQVDDKQRQWEGAIERLLHNFGLSMLVPDSLYSQISQYVERTHLRGKLVYFRVKSDVPIKADTPITNSIVQKCLIKPDSKFYSWILHELTTRFNYICCESMDEFRRMPFAITISGQIKAAGLRHEKDDRHNLNDRSRFILGWNNQDKIRVLQEQLAQIQQQGTSIIQQLAAIESDQRKMNEQRDYGRDLLKFESYSTFDWQAVVADIQKLLQEKQVIETSSDILRSLQLQLGEVQSTIINYESLKSKEDKQLGADEQQLKDIEVQILLAQERSLLLKDAAIIQKLTELVDKQFVGQFLSLQNIHKFIEEITRFLNRQCDKQATKSNELRDQIIQQMQSYKNNYPVETMEIDASTQSIAEFGRLLSHLEADGLPHHESRFKALLKENTINGISLFQKQLTTEGEDIELKIKTINQSLADIEYSSGTYIKLQTEQSRDIEIREFKQELKLCLEDTLGSGHFYDETKFLQVKSLVERFKGRSGLVDQDERWTKKVCDVRNWYLFAASERWSEDNKEKEFHSDSSGKSGGQKEKLAYTILASALAYQFGLEQGASKSRTFRFVMIDEAFGRGSDESTRYGLKLFQKLNLQLLIVTPLQKIQVIEDYIHSLHFVANRQGNNSVLSNVSITDYQQNKQQYHSEYTHD